MPVTPQTPKNYKTLTGHTSPETAFVVPDYPYGWNLRTSIRYWIETKKGHGQRFVSQTLNPKTGKWNKPKASTYHVLAIIARHDDGTIARVTSPSSLAPWTHDGSTWTIDADQEPAADNKHGIYVTYNKAEARKYIGTLCKVILSGTIIEGETGARGQKARLLEVDGLDEAAFKFIGHFPLFHTDRFDPGSGASS